MRVATTKRGRPRKERTEPTGPTFPKGTTHVSSNARDWYKAKNPPKQVRYARTDTQKYFRRRRDESEVHNKVNVWTPVTAAHVEHMGKEGVFG
ncbi:MAG: hypothetical protein JJ916_04065 [Phycisphaerales bacterium]|nr:hypothetical protein [Phycisphaerales bacterium]